MVVVAVVVVMMMKEQEEEGMIVVVTTIFKDLLCGVFFSLLSRVSFSPLDSK